MESRKKGKRSRQTEDSTNRVCCLNLSADVVVQETKKGFSGPNRIKQPAVESGYTITMAYIHSQPQHTSFLPQRVERERESKSGLEGGWVHARMEGGIAIY